MFRDGKLRNNSIKTNLQNYYQNYFPDPHLKQVPLVDLSANISYPFIINLNIEKNGYSCLNLAVEK